MRKRILLVGPSPLSRSASRAPTTRSIFANDQTPAVSPHSRLAFDRGDRRSVLERVERRVLRLDRDSALSGRRLDSLGQGSAERWNVDALVGLLMHFGVALGWSRCSFYFSQCARRGFGACSPRRWACSALRPCMARASGW